MDLIKSRRPLTVNIALVFILLNSLVWLVLAVTILLDVHPGIPDLPYIKPFMVIASVGFAILLLLLVIFLIRHSRTAYILALTVLGATILLTVFDQLGWSDMVVILLNLVPFILLIVDRRWYLPAQPGVLDEPRVE